MDEVVLWGATGHAKVLKEAISNTGFHLAALVDNRPVTSPFPMVPVLNGKNGLVSWLNDRGDISNLYSAVAVGGPRGRERLSLMEVFREQGLAILTVVHSTAFVSADALIGEGCQVLAQAAVCTHVRLGPGVIVNTSASIDHDSVIEPGVHIGPGAHLAGEVTVGRHAFIGTGATVLPGICVGEEAIIGAGAVVVKNVPPRTTVTGNPAKRRSKT